jgi:hypothetical protein
LWSTQALGQVPGEPEARTEWERKAGELGAYREITGWDHPGGAIGSEPSRGNPEAWAEWHTAFAEMARVEGIDVRHLSDGQLFARRHAYEAETSWAPKHVAEELRAARRQEQFSRVEATRHSYETAAAARHGKHEQAELHGHAARSWAALGRRAALVRQTLAEAHDTRCQWEAITEPTRRLARAADIELKRRDVIGPHDQLKSAEPEGFNYEEGRRQPTYGSSRGWTAAPTCPANPSQNRSPPPNESKGRWKSSASPLAATSPNSRCRSTRSRSTTASGKPRSTSATPYESPPKTQTR